MPIQGIGPQFNLGEIAKQYEKVTEDQYAKYVREEIWKIDQMTHYEMAHFWRFASSGHIYFNRSLPFFEYFKKKFAELGGFTSEISKRLG